MRPGRVDNINGRAVAGNDWNLKLRLQPGRYLHGSTCYRKGRGNPNRFPSLNFNQAPNLVRVNSADLQIGGDHHSRGPVMKIESGIETAVPVPAH